jgi:hypothetical protein
MKRHLLRATVILSIVTTLVLMASVNMLAQEKVFSGPYALAEVGRQNIVGGSLVDNIDVLSQDTRTVFGLQVGLRYQFDLGFLLGMEVGIGSMDGDLSLSDPANQLDIIYKNDKQTLYGLTGGFVFGAKKEWLVFGYLSEATRKFNVAITQGTVRFNQKDEQGMLRYGVGLERHIIKYLNLRISAGTGHADFGDQQTNIKVKNKFEFAASVVFQL